MSGYQVRGNVIGEKESNTIVEQGIPGLYQ
jgi:hypothetical protein